MTVDADTLAVYEQKAIEWTQARRGKDLGPAHRLTERLVTADPVVLDIGCGPGYHCAELPGQVIGLDPAAAMLDLVGTRVPGANRLRAEAAHIPLRTGTVDGALCAAAWVHLRRAALPMALAELHRVLTPGGVAEIVMFGGDEDLALIESGDFAGRRFSRWRDDHLRDVIDGAGFEIEHWTNRRTDHWPALEFGLRRRRSLPDFVGDPMRLLVCGLNPSLYAADTGVGFGRPGNRFWPAAMAAGLVDVDRDPRAALRDHGVGMTDLVKRATRRADELEPAEYRAGIHRLDRLCAWLRPAAVCIVGLSGWRIAVDRHATPGWQARRLGDTAVYVMPSTSGLNAHAQLPDLTAHLAAAATGPQAGR